MICPVCCHDNLPGAEECVNCGQDMTQLDAPAPANLLERSLMEDPVWLINRTTSPVTIPPTTPLSVAIQTLLTHNIGAVLVVDGGGKLLGIFSERDILLKFAGQYDDYSGLTVQQFMTASPETVKANDTLAFALHKMDIGGYRHLPVLEEARPVGIISVRDMLRHITKLCKPG